MPKKTFKNNPALQFITPVEVAEDEASQPITSVRQAAVSRPAQTKSRRVQLLMQPALHDRLKEIARLRGISLNDLVHTAMEAYARDAIEP